MQTAYSEIVLPLLRWQPLPSTVFGPVKGTSPSLADWIERRAGQLKPKSAALRSVAEDCPGLVDNTPPVLALPRMPAQLLKQSRHRTPRLYVAALRNARLATRFIEVIGPHDRLFDDLEYLAAGENYRASSLLRPRLPGLRRHRGTFAIICTGRALNYYHWLNDCLTRLWLLDQQPEQRFRLIIPDRVFPFHTESLNLLGWHGDRLARFGEEHWEVENLLVPSLTNQASHSNPMACRWLRTKLLNATGAGATSKPLRLYISRRLATKRRLLNEPEIIAALKKFGFQEIAGEQLSFADQVRLFSTAEVVVGPHGAGFSNVMFMPAGGLLVELNPFRRVKPCYFSLASAVGVRYACVTDAPDAPDVPEDSAETPGEYQSEQDFTVPVQRVRQALSQLGF